MKRVVLSGIRKFSVVDAARPRLDNRDDVLLRVKSVGICGSDIHYYKEGGIGSQKVHFPFTVGHECSAVVEEIGVDVRRVKRSDLVAIDPCISCGTCEQCKSGREHTCLNQKFLGSPGQAEGCLQEYIVVPERNCYVVPQRFKHEMAALVEPLSIGYYAVKLMQMTFNGKGKSVSDARQVFAAILGAGPIGLSVLQFLKAEGFGNILVTDRLDYRLGIGQRSGASWIANPDEQISADGVVGLNPEMFDVVFECCGEQQALDQAVEMLKPGGALFIVGIPEADRISFDINLLRRKEIRIQNVRRQNKSVQPVIDLISSGKIDPDFMVTHKFGLEETEEGFRTVANYEDGVIKAIIEV